MAKKKAVKKTTPKKAVKKTSGSSAALTADQQKKVRKLLKSKDAGNVKLAISLLESTDATTDDWNDVFSTTVLSQLVNTLDVDVWNAVAAAFQTHKSLLNEFGDLAGELFGKLSDQYQRRAVANRKRLCSFLEVVLPSLQPQMSPTIGRCLSKYHGELYLDGLTSLSDAAAESLGEHQGGLYLYGLTSLSDAAVESLSKHKVKYLHLDGLTSLSDAAAESLMKNYRGACTGGSRKHRELSLDGLESLSVAAVESLSACIPGEEVVASFYERLGKRRLHEDRNRLHEARNRRLLEQPVNEQLDFLTGVWTSLDDQARRKILLLATGAMSQEE